MPNYQQNPTNLAAFLQGLKGIQDWGARRQDEQNKESQMNLASQIASQKQQQNLQSLSDLVKAQKPGEKTSYNLTPEGGVSTLQQQQMINPMAVIREEQLQQGKMEGMGKRYEKLSGFMSSLQNLERVTNRDGSGGVVTNPDSKLVSVGPMMSAVPNKAIGIMEYLGKAPQGSSEEREALQQLQLQYQRAMTGVRTSSEMMDREKEAMGFIGSGDPNLVAKGVRDLANNVTSATKAIQASYTPDVRERVHQTMGDPMDFLGKVYQDQPTKTKAASSTMPGANSSSQTQPVPGQNSTISQPNSSMIPQGAKKQYSPSRNQTRLVYPDGRVEVLNGQQ